MVAQALRDFVAQTKYLNYGESFIHLVRIVTTCNVLATPYTLAMFFFCFIGSRNGVVVDVYWNIYSVVLKFWWGDLLYASYDEGTYCTPVMMRGPVVRQLWWGDLLYASYDEGTCCMPVMMRGPVVRQLWWGDLLYASCAWEETNKDRDKFHVFSHLNSLGGGEGLRFRLLP